MCNSYIAWEKVHSEVKEGLFIIWFLHWMVLACTVQCEIIHTIEHIHVVSSVKCVKFTCGSFAVHLNALNWVAKHESYFLKIKANVNIVLQTLPFWNVLKCIIQQIPLNRCAQKHILILKHGEMSHVMWNTFITISKYINSPYMYTNNIHTYM